MREPDVAARPTQEPADADRQDQKRNFPPRQEGIRRANRPHLRGMREKQVSGLHIRKIGAMMVLGKPGNPGSKGMLGCQVVMLGYVRLG